MGRVLGPACCGFATFSGLPPSLVFTDTPRRHHWRRVGVRNGRSRSELPAIWNVSSAAQHVIEVKPRGFEPLTSAVQSQSDVTVAVRRCSKTLANSGIPPFEPSRLFAIARMV